MYQSDQWVVSLVNGDTETHYVQPVIKQVVCENKDSATKEIHRIVTAFLRSNYRVCEKHEKEDSVEVKVEGRSSYCEYWVTAKLAPGNAHIDLSKELGLVMKISQNETDLVTVSFDEEAVEKEWMEELFDDDYVDEEELGDAGAELYDIQCLQLEDAITKTRRRYDFCVSEKYKKYFLHE
jgi:hypothetical protein